MAYLPASVPRSHLGLSGLGCGCGMGCAECGGRCGMGDVPVDPALATKQLQVQLGRFMGPQVPMLLRLRDTKIPVTGTLDLGTALFATTVMQHRAAEALASGRGGNVDVNQAAIAQANPLGYVAANLPGTVELVQLYADAKGLASADMPADLSRALRDPATMAIVGGIALGIYLFTRRR